MYLFVGNLHRKKTQIYKTIHLREKKIYLDNTSFISNLIKFIIK